MSTIGAVVLSYDVDRRHTEVKAAIKERGYFDNWNYQGAPSHDMPNTTVWHKTKTSVTAITDIQQVCASLGVRLEKAVAVIATEFSGI